MRLDEQFQASPMFQRMKAEQAYREMERRAAKLRFAEIVRNVWAERTFLFRIAIVGLVIGLLIAFLIPARYTSTARLMPPDNHATSFSQAAISLRGPGFGELATDMLGLKSNSDVFVGILNSRTIQDRIIQQFDLKHVYGTKRMDDARLVLASKVAVSIDRKSDMISINVTDHSPQRAAAMANAYVTELNQLVVDLSTSSARRERVFLEGYLAQVKQDLENAEREFSLFASRNSAVDINEQGKALVGAAANLQGQLIVAQSELEALRQTYADTHIRVRTAKARIEELEAQLRKLAGHDHSDAIGPKTEASEFYPSLRKLPMLGVTYADLYRKRKVQQVVYELLTQEYNLAKVQEARDILSVKVLDPPNVPERKSFPPRLLIAATSTCLAIAVGILVVLGSKSWNDRDPADLTKAVAMEIWIDLKEKRFLTQENALEKSARSSDAMSHTRGLLSFLGLRNAFRHGCEPFSPSESIGEREPHETKLSDTLKT